MTDPPIPRLPSALDDSLPLESILCTEELRLRATRPPDYQKENRALTKLARALAASQPGILQTFADTLLDVTGCDSAGLSLLTKDGTEFYRPAVAGAWAGNIADRTPRQCSPCGDAVDSNCPLLFRHFGRRYTAFLELMPRAEECLVVPFHIDGKVAGTMWAVMHTDRRRFDAEDERIMTSLGSFAAASQIYAATEAEEQDFRLMVDSIPTLVYTMTPAGEVEFVNRRVLEYFCRTAGELKDWDKIGCVHPDDLPHVLASVRRSVEFGEPHEVQQRLRRVDGAYRWFQSRTHAVRDANGRLLRWFAALTDIEDLKHAEDAAHAVSDLRETVDGIPGLVATMTAEGELESANQRILSYTGRTAGQLKDWQTLVHPEDRSRALSSWRDSLETGNALDIELRIAGADGVFRWFQHRAVPQVDANGVRVRWYILLTEIDQQKKIEERLRDSEAFLLDAQRLSHTGSWKHNLASGAVSITPEIARIYAVAPHEAANTADFFFSRVHPEDVSALAADYTRALLEKRDFAADFRIVLGDGSIRFIRNSGHPRLNAAGEVVEVLGTAIDITEQTASRAELRAIINTIPALSWSTRPDGYVEFLSQRWLDFTGLSEEQALGFGWAVTIHPDDASRLVEYWQAALTSGTHVDVEARLRRSDGVYRWLLFRADPLRDESGQIVKWYGTNFDIEDRKRAEDEVRQNERNLRSIINTIPTLSWSTRPDGYVEFLSQRWLDFTGLSEEQALGFGWAVSIHPEDAPRLVQYWQAALASGSYVDVEARLRRSDGVYRWLLFRANPLRDETGEIVKWYGTNFDIEDRKQAEVALRGSERTLRLIFDTMPALISVTGRQGELERINRQMSDYFGKSLQEMRDWQNPRFTFDERQSAVHPDDLNAVTASFGISLRTGAPFNYEVRLRQADGVYRWFQVRGLPLRDDQGEVVRWYNLHVDVEDRKRAEEALRASEHNLRLIFDTIPALVCTMNAQGELELVNRQIYDYFGIPLDDLKDWAFIGAVHADDLEAVVGRWRHSVETGEPYNIEHRIRRADGVYRWFRVSGLPLRNPEGHIVRWYVLLIDCEEQHRAELALRASELNLRQLTETIPEMLWSATPQGIIDYCNTRFLNYTGFSNERVMEGGWPDTMHPDDAARVTPVWIACVATGKPYRVEVRTFHAADQSYRWCVVAGLPLLDEQGRILRWHGTVVDFHDRKNAEEELRNTQAELAHMTRVMTMGELTASLAHELNQPLAAVIASGDSCTAWLTSVPPNLDKARASADRVIQAATQASAVIQRTRTMFRKAPAVRTALRINEVIDEAISLIQGEVVSKHIFLRRELAEAPPLVSADRVQIAQVILNLAMNGIEAMAEMETGPRVLAIKSRLSHDNEIHVSVADAGPGFDPHAAARLFDPFFTTKANGIGIGLSISKSIIEAHGGRLWVTENEPQGAVFHFSLPALPVVAAE